MGKGALEERRQLLGVDIDLAGPAHGSGGGGSSGSGAAPAQQHLASPRPQPPPSPAASGSGPQEVTPSAAYISRLKEAAAAGPARTRQHTAGVALFGALLFVAGAAPGLLPATFLVFALTALPWRLLDFHRKKWTFFTIDFCYFVNAFVALFLLFAPNDPRAEALAYALADGPLAGALAAWQCAWVFGDEEHTTSAAAGARPEPLWAWLVAAPLAFYLAWQLVYFVIVQVLFRGFIKREGYDTSYNCLARRAAKTNNIWNRLVRRGSTLRRVSMYGLLQLAFTAIALAAFLPTYFSYPLALAYQAVKFLLPIYYGGKFACEKLPNRALRQALGFQAGGGLRVAGHTGHHSSGHHTNHHAGGHNAGHGHVQLARGPSSGGKARPRAQAGGGGGAIGGATSSGPIGGAGGRGAAPAASCASEGLGAELRQRPAARPGGAGVVAF